MHCLRQLIRYGVILLALFLVACDGNQSIVNNIEERDANEIIVFLASKNIAAQKIQASSGEAGGPTLSSTMFNISVDNERSTEAMAYLNQVGLPRRKGATLLELFSKQGLMSSDREETIRYQAGLSEELRNTIRKIDGILDADVQISFPPAETIPGVTPPKITAAVYIKHRGILEDPNSHMETKIRRLLAGSVNGLDFENVSVISDRSRFADISLTPDIEKIGSKNLQQAYVSIWSIVMTKGSLAKFRMLFFSLIVVIVLLLAALGWALFKIFYPRLLASKQELPDSQEG